MVSFANEINENSGSAKQETLDEKLISQVSFYARGDLCPMQGVIGGIVAQEVMKVGARACLRNSWNTWGETQVLKKCQACQAWKPSCQTRQVNGGMKLNKMRFFSFSIDSLLSHHAEISRWDRLTSRQLRRVRCQGSFLVVLNLKHTTNPSLSQACSGKFMPVKQFLYFDALECLADEEPQDDAKFPVNRQSMVWHVKLFPPLFCLLLFQVLC